jgi:hypothetical protein
MWTLTEEACEFLAHWVGGTTRRELTRLLGYTPRRLTILISDGFARRKRATALYDPHTKTWMSCVETKELLGIKAPRDVLTVMLAERALAGPREPRFPSPVLDTVAFRRDPDPEIFRTLVGACARRRPVDIVYLARTRRIAVRFSPHTIVRTAHRVHIRGYSGFAPGDAPAFWDLVPTRVVSADLAPKNDYVDGKHDEKWRQPIFVTLVLDPAVPSSMREAIRLEHGMNSDTLVLGPIPKAVAPYVAAEYTRRLYEGYELSVWTIKQN